MDIVILLEDPLTVIIRKKGLLLKNAGARPWNRDEVDLRIVQEIKEGKNRIIDSEQEVGSYPKMESTFQSFNPEDWNLENLTKITK